MAVLINLINLIPGLLLISAISLSAWYGSSYTVLSPVVLAIIFGFFIGNVFKPAHLFQSGISFSEKKLLALAIILLGFQLDLSVFSSLGTEVLIFIVSIVFISLCIGYVIARMCKLSPEFSLLLAVGNSICGSAAIAAVQPLVKPKQFETGLSISVVNLLGVLGIFLVPLVANYFLEMTSLSNGIMIGGTLQSIGQVAAAGYSINNETGEIAILVKMGRILMLCPTLILLSIFLYLKSDSHQNRRSCPIPLFMVLFVVVISINNSYVIPESTLLAAKSSTKYLLIAAMAGLGLRINLSTVIQQGAKSLFVGTVIFVFQIIFTLSFIAIFFSSNTNWLQALFFKLHAFIGLLLRLKSE